MKILFIGGTTVCLLTAAGLGFATASNEDPEANVATTAYSEDLRVSWNDIRIVTDNYLVPAYVCPDLDSEMYEDCVPRWRVGEYEVLVLPATK